MTVSQQTAVIIGAGPAGLTAALEFCRRSSIRPIVLEASTRVGGISCTIRHNGNGIDIGGHRFFSKSDRVMDWRTEIMPVATDGNCASTSISYQNRHRKVATLNLFLVGRNGMHKYNNQDHSMLMAMMAVDNILGGIKSKQNLWEVNTEQEYHEQKTRMPDETAEAAAVETAKPESNEGIAA